MRIAETGLTFTPATAHIKPGGYVRWVNASNPTVHYRHQRFLGGTDMETATNPSAPDYGAIKQRQQATWASGDFGRIGVRLQIVGETLCEAVNLRAGERVLDVAAGNGNAALAAARRFADVTAVDYVPVLLEQAHRRAEADGLPLVTREADAEDLPFADGVI